jgi:hypothetical protein
LRDRPLQSGFFLENVGCSLTTEERHKKSTTLIGFFAFLLSRRKAESFTQSVQENKKCIFMTLRRLAEGE